MGVGSSKWQGAIEGDWEHPATPPATSRATNPRQHRPKDLNKTRRDIHLVEIKNCEDTRPQNQLDAAKKQHKDLCNIQGASVTVTIHIGKQFLILHLEYAFYNALLHWYRSFGLGSPQL